MNTNKKSITQFTDKYQKTGAVGQILLKHFFATIKKLIPKDILSVAEIGCGAGYSTKVLRDFFPSGTPFFASDIDPELVALTQSQNQGITSAVESIYTLNHQDNSFDAVFCLEVMEHLENPRAALKELARITNSYVIISVPHEPLWRALNFARGSYLKDFGNTPGHINHWSKRGMKQFVAQEFDIVHATTSLPWTIILAKKRTWK